MRARSPAGPFHPPPSTTIHHGIKRAIHHQLDLRVSRRRHQPDRWHFDFVGGESDALAQAQLDAAGAMLMGRATYDAYASSWPDRDGALRRPAQRHAEVRRLDDADRSGLGRHHRAGG
jgi:dihydrofolate reductase